MNVEFSQHSEKKSVAETSGGEDVCFKVSGGEEEDAYISPNHFLIVIAFSILFVVVTVHALTSCHRLTKVTL